jgi:hypothetical protein
MCSKLTFLKTSVTYSFIFLTLIASCQTPKEKKAVEAENKLDVSMITFLSLFNENLTETKNDLRQYNFQHSGTNNSIDEDGLNSNYFIRVNANDTDAIIIHSYPNIEGNERVFVGLNDFTLQRKILAELTYKNFKLLKQKNTTMDSSSFYIANYDTDKPRYLVSTIRSIPTGKLLTLDLMSQQQFEIVKHLIFPDSSFHIDEFLAFKKTIVDVDKSPGTFQWDNEVYRNTRYKFRVQFPKNWEYDNGTARHTLARAINEKKIAAISVSVTPLSKKLEFPNNIFKSGIPINKMEAFMNDAMALQNSKIENFNIQKGFLNNFPAYLYEFTSVQKMGTDINTYLSKQVQCYYDNNIYQINLNIPVELYTQDIASTFKKVINSFNFEIAY